MGTTLIAIVTQASGSQNTGVGALVIVFIIGILLFTRADAACKAASY